MLAWAAGMGERTILHQKWGRSRRKSQQPRSLPGPAKGALQTQRWLGLELHLHKSYLGIIACYPFQRDSYCPSGTFQEKFPPSFFFKPEDKNYTSGETPQLSEANKAQKRWIMRYPASSQHCYKGIFCNLFFIKIIIKTSRYQFWPLSQLLHIKLLGCAWLEEAETNPPGSPSKELSRPTVSTRFRSHHKLPFMLHPEWFFYPSGLSFKKSHHFPKDTEPSDKNYSQHHLLLLQAAPPSHIFPEFLKNLS